MVMCSVWANNGHGPQCERPVLKDGMCAVHWQAEEDKLKRRRHQQEIDRAWQETGGRCTRCATNVNVRVIESKAGRRRRLVVICEGCAGATGVALPSEEKTLVATKPAMIPFQNGFIVVSIGDRVGPSSYAARNAPKGVFAKVGRTPHRGVVA